MLIVFKSLRFSFLKKKTQKTPLSQNLKMLALITTDINIVFATMPSITPKKHKL